MIISHNHIFVLLNTQFNKPIIKFWKCCEITAEFLLIRLHQDDDDGVQMQFGACHKCLLTRAVAQLLNSCFHMEIALA